MIQPAFLQQRAAAITTLLLRAFPRVVQGNHLFLEWMNVSGTDGKASGSQLLERIAHLESAMKAPAGIRYDEYRELERLRALARVTSPRHSKKAPTPLES